MKVLYSWLQDYIEEELPPVEELAERLTLRAYEVEDVEEMEVGGKKDWVIDIDVLPNRAADSLGHYGVAREIAVLFELTFKKAATEGVTFAENIRTQDLVHLSIEDKKLCRRAMKRVVVDVKVGESPKWLQERLNALDQRSINNVVDITNYVMLETGQPVHAFDYDKVSGEGAKKVVIRSARDGERIVALDENEYELSEGIIVIADSEKPLDIAGIKGGKASAIDEGTARVMLSVCNFDPIAVRTASAKLNLRSDASKRFENNPSPKNALHALERLSMLISDIAHGRSTQDYAEVYPHPVVARHIFISKETISRILGVDIPQEKIKEILERLSCTHVQRDDGVYDVEVPHYRRELEETADLVEEVGRVYGYENITEQALTLEAKPAINKHFYWSNIVRDVLVARGFSEVYTYSFQNEGDIEVKNKIAEDKGFLRKSLVPGLTASREHNLKYLPLYESDDLLIFEIGNVFERDRQYLQLGLIIEPKRGKERSMWVEKAEKALSDALGTDVTIEEREGVYLLDLSELIEKLPQPDSYENLQKADLGRKYKQFSVFPYVLRDVAVWTPQEVGSLEVEKLIREEAGEWLVNMNLFDEFAKDGRVSYAFRLVFQAQDKTLSDSEANEVMDRVYTVLAKQEGWEVR